MMTTAVVSGHNHAGRDPDTGETEKADLLLQFYAKRDEEEDS